MFEIHLNFFLSVVYVNAVFAQKNRKETLKIFKAAKLNGQMEKYFQSLINVIERLNKGIFRQLAIIIYSNTEMEFIIFFRIQVPQKSDENYVKIVIRDQNIYVNGLRVNKIVDCLKIWKVLLIDILTIHL